MKPTTQHLHRRGSGRGLAFARRMFTLLALNLVAAHAAEVTPLPVADQRALPKPELIRIGIAPGTWGGVNRNDASAAIAAWAKIIMQQRGLTVNVETKLFESDDEMGAALRGGHVDAVSMLSQQFLALDPKLQPDTVFLAARNRSSVERYVLLVHRASGIEDLSGLRGAKLLLDSHARASLAPQWLDVLLARRSLGSMTNFFQTVSRMDNPSKLVLQVFFRQAGACVVSTNTFALAGELNPQLRKELRVLAVSPEVVPALFYFRPGKASPAREQLEPAIVALHEQPAGQQVLTIFQCEQMVKSPISCFDTTRALLAEYGRLPRPASKAPKSGKLVKRTVP